MAKPELISRYMASEPNNLSTILYYAMLVLCKSSKSINYVECQLFPTFHDDFLFKSLKYILYLPLKFTSGPHIRPCNKVNSETNP